MINLFNFGIKAEVHIVTKYDNSQIKMNKKSVKLPKNSAVCWNIIIHKIEIRKKLNKIQVDWLSEKTKSLNKVQLGNKMCNMMWNIIYLKQTTWL